MVIIPAVKKSFIQGLFSLDTLERLYDHDGKWGVCGITDIISTSTCISLFLILFAPSFGLIAGSEWGMWFWKISAVVSLACVILAIVSHWIRDKIHSTLVQADHPIYCRHYWEKKY